MERSLKMVPLLITIPRDAGSKDYQAQNRDNRDMMREVVSVVESFYSNLNVLYNKYKLVKNLFVGSPHVVLEIVAKDREIFFYIAVPFAFLDLVEKSLSAQYPECNIERAEEHNIFNASWGIENVSGGELRASNSFFFPFRTYQELDSEPLEALTSSLSKLEDGEGAAIQILIRPAKGSIVKKVNNIAREMQNGKKRSLLDSAINAALVKTEKPTGGERLTPMEEEAVKAIERKSSKPIFETMIRVVVSAQSNIKAENVARQISSSFNQFGNQNFNSFTFKPARNSEELVTDYVFRFFVHRILSSNTLFRFHRGYNIFLNTEELASIFHLPNFLVTTPGIRWLPSKKAAPPTFVPDEGVVIGHSIYRGEDNVIRISENDRRRHLYILGQTGTGKSTSMINMIISDIREGKGICYIDPHGQDLE